MTQSLLGIAAGLIRPNFSARQQGEPAQGASTAARSQKQGASTILPRARPKSAILTGNSIQRRVGKPRMERDCCASAKASCLARHAIKASLAAAALFFAGTAAAAPDAKDPALGTNSLAGIERQGVLGQLDVWNIPGSEFHLLVGSQYGEILIARLISPPTLWRNAIESPIDFFNADQLCAVDGVLPSNDPDNRSSRAFRDLPGEIRDDGIDPVHWDSSMSARAVSKGAPDRPEYSGFEETNRLQSEASPALIDESSVLKAIREDSFWFSVGKRGAPTVYAIIDPECPHCAKATANLKDEIELGRLQLRVVPVAALGERSANLIAALLTDQEPPNAFLRHEIQMGTFGTSDLVPIEFMSLRPELRDAIDNNLALASRLRIGGVPFFAFESSDGPKTHFGVAQPETFIGAIPDAYEGGSN